MLGGLQDRGEAVMSCVECHHERLSESPHGPIVAVSFRGIYPTGSLGNGHAQGMRDYLAAIVGQANPTAVLLDLSDLEYRGGDALGMLAVPLRSLPFCLVARGATAEAVRPLVGPGYIFGVFGETLFETREQGLMDLTARVSGRR